MIVVQKYKSQARFLVVGGSSTLLDFVIYMLLSTKVDITISKCISMSISSIYSFFINKNWTFSDSEKITIVLALKYILCVLINIGVNTLVNTLTFSITNNKIISFIIATGIAMIVNFVIQKEVVFRGGKK
ncbi:GtrA family protein [bacterium]|nr:GtrA family protein [bacterium]